MEKQDGLVADRLLNGLRGILALLVLELALIYPCWAQLAGLDGLKPDPSTVSLIKNAIVSYRAGDLAAGDQLAATINDPLAKISLEWVALRTAQEKAGFNRINEFLGNNPDWPTLQLIRKKGEEALYNEPRDDAAVLAYFKTRAPLTPTGRYLLAASFKAAGRVKEAADTIRKSWREDNYPSDVEAEIMARFKDDLTEADHRERMDNLLFAENWAAAQRAAEWAGGDSLTLAKIRISVGKRAPDAEKFLQAASPFIKKEQGYILSEAQFLRRNDRLPEAAAALAKLPTTVTPFRPDDWWVERRVLIRRLAEIGRAELALEVAKQHPGISSSNLYDAAFTQGWLALDFLKDGAKAEAFFAEAEQRAASDTLKSRAAYWQGLALEAQGKSGKDAFQRASKSPLLYYGQLARMKMGGAELVFRTTPEPDLTHAASVLGFKAIVYLMEAGGNEFAATLASDVAMKLPDAPALSALAAIGRDYGDIRLVTIAGKAALQRGFTFDLDAWPVDGFPMPSEPAVEPSLAYAIARQESSFDPMALSPVGARGLMQLMLPTAQETARKNKIAFAPERLTADAAYNVALGTAHLGELVEYWNGSYILAIASYNAGAGNVKKWIAANGDPRDIGIDPVRWIERIPVSETRFYVQRVMENLEIYRARINGEFKSALADDLKRGSLQ
jgi:soluble lytic murein transglycosylase